MSTLKSICIKFFYFVLMVMCVIFCSCSSEISENENIVNNKGNVKEISVSDIELLQKDINAFCHKMEKPFGYVGSSNYHVEAVTETRSMSNNESDLLLKVSLDEGDSYYVRVTPFEANGSSAIYIGKNGYESEPIVVNTEVVDGSCIGRLVFPDDSYTRATYRGNYGQRVISCIKAAAGSDLIFIVGLAAVFSNTARVVYGGIMAVAALGCMGQ